jgi:hypothetical protein
LNSSSRPSVLRRPSGNRISGAALLQHLLQFAQAAGEAGAALDRQRVGDDAAHEVSPGHVPKDVLGGGGGGLERQLPRHRSEDGGRVEVAGVVAAQQHRAAAREVVLSLDLQSPV